MRNNCRNRIRLGRPRLGIMEWNTKKHGYDSQYSFSVILLFIVKSI